MYDYECQLNNYNVFIIVVVVMFIWFAYESFSTLYIDWMDLKSDLKIYYFHSIVFHYQNCSSSLACGLKWHCVYWRWGQMSFLKMAVKLICDMSLGKRLSCMWCAFTLGFWSPTLHFWFQLLKPGYLTIVNLKTRHITAWKEL